MAFEFHLPDIGEGVVEGEIVGWKVKEGDTVKLDQPIVEIMTDKATVEIPSPRAGTIAKINYGDGQVCPVGAVLVVIEDGGNGKAHAAPVAASTPTVQKKIEVIDATPRSAGQRVRSTPPRTSRTSKRST
jgi:pyruvate/2-oxoglutarate dehydrogenase complex dihydrolipoamide acyltransferase (E2) component